MSASTAAASSPASIKVMTSTGLIHCRMAGSGPALLLLHGWMGTSYSWRKVMPLLAPHFTVIAPDCRGYGESHKPATGYDGRTIKNELRELVAILGLTDPVVVGHDMGALPALLYAADHPDEVRGLGYFDEPLPGYNLDRFTAFTRDNPMVFWWFAFNSQDHLPALMWAGKEAELVDYFVTAMVADTRSLTEGDKAEYVRTLRKPGGLHGSFGWYRDVLETAEQIRAATGTRLTLPVLAMRGEYGVPHVAEQLAPIAADVTGVTIPNCGHLLAEEAPEAVAEAVIARFG